MPKTHLAIFKQPMLDLILDGNKTIETRISKIRIPPYQSVSKGDRVLMKESGGEIKGEFHITKIIYYYAETTLDAKLFDKICETEGLKIFGQDDVMDIHLDVLREKWCRSKYATFMHITDVQRLTTSIHIEKRNRQGWVVKPFLKPNLRTP